MALLAPIPGDSPAGMDVRYEGDHDRIREQLRADAPALLVATGLAMRRFDA